ncbi:MAG: DNA gyrase inhibitor YacG [Gemmataceae bacterium]
MSRVTCPICKAMMPADWSEYPDYPFCSKRCRMIDLGRWLGEDYRVSGKAKDENRSTDAEPGSRFNDEC